MKITCSNRAQKSVLAFCLVALFTLCAHAEQLVELTVKIESDDWSFQMLANRHGISADHSLEPNGILDNARTLRCVIGTNSWVIEAEPGNLIQNVKETIWFTGTNIIAHNMLVPGMSTRRDPQPGTAIGTYPPGGERWTRVWESKDGNPGRTNEADVTPSLAKTCWLAFCSGSFLKQAGRKIPPPSDLWKEYLSAPNGFPDQTTVFHDALGLPRSIEQFANTNQTLLQYQVHQSTNLFGWNIPLSFYLVQYNPSGTNGWQVHLTAKGQVTSIGPGKKIEIPPDAFNYRQN